MKTFYLQFIFLFCLYFNANAQRVKITKPEKADLGYIYYEYTNRLVRQLNLVNLKKGYDGVKIRVWFDGAFYGFKEMYEFSKSKKGYRAIYYAYHTKPAKKAFLEDVVRMEFDTLNLQNDPEIFFDQLKSYQIDTLHAQDNIELADYGVDGITYCFEYADKRHYHFYMSSNPKSYSKKYKQAKLIMDILEFLQNQVAVRERTIKHLKD